MDEWYQESLTPPAVVEVRLRVGWIAEADHVMVQVESLEPVTRIQLGMWSQPHGGLSEADILVGKAIDKLKAELRRLDLLGPFDGV